MEGLTLTSVDDDKCILTGADEQELATPILSLCHGIFTD